MYDDGTAILSPISVDPGPCGKPLSLLPVSHDVLVELKFMKFLDLIRTEWISCTMAAKSISPRFGGWELRIPNIGSI